MSELRKTYEGGLFFVTVTVVGWLDVFNRTEYTDELLKNLHYCQVHKGLEIYSYVIMSSHAHLIIARTEGKLSDVLRDFKGYPAHRLLHLISNNPKEGRREWMMRIFAYHARFHKQNDQHMFWQKTTYPVAMWSPEVVQQKMDYIHLNPVAAGLVTDPTHYWLSSAHPLSPIKTLPL